MSERHTIWSIAERIEERLKELRMTAHAASEMTGRGPDVIRNLLRAAQRGQARYSPRQDTIDDIAKVLMVRPTWLRFGHEPKEFTDAPGLTPDVSHALARTRPTYSQYRGILEEGAYRNSESLDESEPEEEVAIGLDPRFAGHRQYCWKVLGDAYRPFQIDDGMYVSGAFYPDLLDAAKAEDELDPIAADALVVIQISRDSGAEKSFSLRRYQVSRRGIAFTLPHLSERFPDILRPLDWDSLKDDELQIVALVCGAHRIFGPQRFTVDRYDRY